MKKPSFLWAASLVVILLAGCSLHGASTSNTPKAVSLNKASAMLFSGKTEQLTATIDPADASNQVLAWSTDNAGVASVSSSGLVTGLADGTANITVTTAGGKTAACTVTICDVGGVIRAAGRLVETQNNDGGWDWQNPDTNPSTGMPSPPNTLGVTAQGVLDAYRVTGKSEYLAAVMNAYSELLTNSTNGDPSIRKIRGLDILFLVRLSEATGIPAYASFARARYQAAVTELGGGTATGLAQYIRNARLSQSLPPLIAWDIDLYVRAALSLDGYFPNQGFGADAAAMTEVIYTSLYQGTVDFNISNQGQDEYWLSITGAVEAFTITGLHAAERDSLMTSLLASQQPDGHFPGVVSGGNVQTTAYALMTLVKAGKEVPAARAMAYLTRAQGANGGWMETDGFEYTEVDSEVLHAMYECVEGL